MRRRIIRALATAVWVVCAGLAALFPSVSGPWLSALVLPVAAAGFSWRGGAGSAAAGLSLMLCLLLAARGVPVWRLAGAATAFIAVALLCLSEERLLRARLRREGERAQDLERQAGLQEIEKERRRLSIQAREESIGEIGELYQLSMRLLATLDWEQAHPVIEEALVRWIPTLRGEERTRTLQRIHALVDQGQVSVEPLVQSMPLAGTDFQARDRWAIVSGQLALGLQRVALYGQVQKSATHDGLTGLLVRRTFRERLQEEAERSVRRSVPMTFLMVDLDRFKQVNDTYGHLVGDVVLREVANLIRGSVREMDLVARYGGEEFGVLLPEADRDLGFQIAERIRRTIESAPIRAYDEEIHMTVSVGVALCPAQTSDAEELVEKADQAMYRAKETGRNKTVLAES
ncbi:MAG: GGDEF domain-containing protein [Candidatus Omnitrophota bacterium]|nr:GGDEF domain-containing protein [Candidatus Omnitrophota bacterium]